MAAKMRIIWWIYGFTILDRIRNEVIKEKVGVAPMEEKLRETTFIWYGHVNLIHYRLILYIVEESKGDRR